MLILPVLLLLTLFFYLPTLNLFVGGDDLLLLWHIQVPVNFFQIPFTGWEEPIAGRFGYGQAWYAAILYKLFGFQTPIFNLAGIFLRIIAIVSVYKFSATLTKKQSLSLMAAILFAFNTTGIMSNFNFHIHFALALIAFLFFGLSYIFKSYENQSLKTWLIGLAISILGIFLYLIRSFGIILLPVWTIFRYSLLPQKTKNYCLLGSLIIVALSTSLVWILPGAKDLASSHSISGIEHIIKEVLSGKSEPLRAFFVSMGFSVLPSSLYYALAQTLSVDNSIGRFLFPWSILIWTLIYGIFVLPLIQRKKLGKLFLLLAGLGYLSGIIWSKFLLVLLNNNFQIFQGREVVAVALGIDILLLMLFLGLLYLFIEAKIGSTLLICASAIPIFYFPNWIHDPTHVSDSSFRYLTLTSGFVAIGLACLIYILYLHRNYFISVGSIFQGRIYFIVAALIFLFILNANVQQTSAVMTEEINTRQPKIFLSNWDFVRSNVNFQKTPLIVLIWTDGDIFNVMMEFFRHQGLALISQRPWKAQLPNEMRLYYNFKDSMDQICGWRAKGIIFNPGNLYLFKLNKDLTMETQFEEGREKLKTWDKYCSDPTQKGIEAGELIPKATL